MPQHVVGKLWKTGRAKPGSGGTSVEKPSPKVEIVSWPVEKPREAGRDLRGAGERDRPLGSPGPTWRPTRWIEDSVMTTAEGRGGGVWGEKTRSPRHPSLTRRWIQTAVAEHRLAFEREMERHRESFSDELDRFWRAKRPRSV